MTIKIKDTRYFWMKAYTHINGVKMTAVDKVVYESLHAFASTTERVSPSVAYLSAINGFSTTAVKDSLKRLEAAKLIIKHSNGNRANSYELNLNELMKLNNGYREMIVAAQEEAAAEKTERMAKIAKAPVVVKALDMSRAAVETVLGILRSMGVTIPTDAPETPESVAKPSRLSAPIKVAPVKPAEDDDEPYSFPWEKKKTKAQMEEEERWLEEVLAKQTSRKTFDPEGW